MTKDTPAILGYEIGEMLWEENGAEFWAATQDGLAVTIAIPNSVTDLDIRDRFQHQIIIAEKLVGIAGIQNLTDSGISKADIPFMVFDGYTAADLATEIETDGGLEWQDGLGVITEIAEAVSAMHELEVFHRSLSIDSIRIGDDGSPIIASFDAAVIGNNTARKTGTINPAFSAPELGDGYEAISAKLADIYSLGALLWSLIEGREPFDYHEESTASQLADLLSEQAPQQVCHVIETALSAEPADRQQSVSEFVEDVRKASHSAGLITEPIVPPPASDTIFFEDINESKSEAAESSLDLVGNAKDSVPTSDDKTTTLAPINLATPAEDEVIEVVVAPASESDSRGFPFLAVLASSIITAMICIAGFAFFSDSLLGRETIGDYVGLGLEEVEEALAESSVVIETQSGRLDGSEAGEVIEQLPRAGSVLDSGAVLRLTVSDGAELREVPDPNGLGVDEVKQLLESKGFVFGEIVEERDSATVAKGAVIELQIDGDRIDGSYPGGETFNVVISTGVVTIPRITRDEIQSILVSELQLEVTEVEQFSDQVSSGQVIRTEPPTGSKVVPGSTVRVVIATDIPVGPQNIPNVVGRTVKQASDALKKAGFNPQLVSATPGNCSFPFNNDRCENSENDRIWKYEPNGKANAGSTIRIFASAQAINEFKNDSDDDE